MISQIIIEQVQDLLNWPFAGAVSILLLIATFLVFYAYHRILGLESLMGVSHGQSGSSGRTRPLRGTIFRTILGALGFFSDRLQRGIEAISAVAGIRRPRGVLVTCSILVLLFLCVPVAVMIPISFTERPVPDWPPQGFTLRWYETIWASPQWTQAAVRSFIVGICSALVAMAIGVPAAFALARNPLRGKTLVLAIILSPMIIPRIIIAVALFYLYAQIGIVGTYLGLIVGHAIVSVPYVVITVVAALKNYDMRYDRLPGASAPTLPRPSIVLRYRSWARR